MAPLPIKAFIVDDEFQSRTVISLMLNQIFADISIAGEANTVKDALKAIEELKPQIVFLDIQMRNETGFDLLDQLKEIEFEIIFTTAHSEFAVRAFRYSALDYLMKPIDTEEFVAAVRKAKDRIFSRQTSTKKQIQLLNDHLNESPGKVLGKIAIPAANGLLFIHIADIIYCRGLGNYTEFFLADKQKITSTHTLKWYEDVLSDNQFFRVHKSYLINPAHIKKYIRGEGGTAIMSNGHEIEIARRNKAAFLSLFKG